MLFGADIFEKDQDSRRIQFSNDLLGTESDTGIDQNRAQIHPKLLPILPLTRDAEHGNDNSSSDEDSFYSTQKSFHKKTFIFTLLIGTVGFLASSLFMGFGISSETNQQEVKFQIRADEFRHDFVMAWEDYETASRWLHQACAQQNISRQDFVDIYEYLTTGLVVQVGLV